MTLKTQLMVFGAGFVLCLAIVIPLMSRQNQPVISNPVKRPEPPHRNINPQDFQRPKQDGANSKPSKRSWTTTLAPLYTVAIFIYVLYIVYRITTRKNANSKMQLNNKSRAKQVRERTKITKHELGQLEDKLAESEKAVEIILEKARIAMKDAYNKEMSESSLSDSSEDEGAKIEELDSTSTTSSANNDSHQDSTSTGNEQMTPVHHRKTHHRSRKSIDDDCSTSSEDAESGIYHPGLNLQVSTIEHYHSRSSLVDENISTNHEQSDFESENTDYSEVGDIKETEENKDAENDKTAQSVESSSNRTVCDEQKQQIVKENEELMETTKQVLSAMDEIRGFIKEQQD